MRPDKILYFIEGPLPTTEDYAAALELRANVAFRNALAVPLEAHSLEECDGVAGKVPAIYRSHFPPAELAIARTKAQLRALQARIGDRPAKPVERPGTLPTDPEMGTLPSLPEEGEGEIEGQRTGELRRPPEASQLPAERPRGELGRPPEAGQLPAEPSRGGRPPEPTQPIVEPPKAATKPVVGKDKGWTPNK